MNWEIRKRVRNLTTGFEQDLGETGRRENGLEGFIQRWAEMDLEHN